MKIDSHYTQHGGPWSRGSADAYYGRIFKPHYYVGDTYFSKCVDGKDMTQAEIAAYTAGYHEQVASGDFKQWD